MFCSKDVFKFKFENLKEDDKSEMSSDRTAATQMQKTVLAKFSAPSSYSSSESEAEYDEEAEESDQESHTENKTSMDHNRREVNLLTNRKNGFHKSGHEEEPMKISKTLTFLSDSDSAQIDEALKFFCRTQSLDELRKDWRVTRESMVQVLVF